MMKAKEIKKRVMKHYSELKSAKSIEQKYPELELNDGKKHVLFVQCLLERNSFYRTYLPYLILNNTESHSAIIASIQKQDFNKEFEDYDVFLQVDLVKWADYIVFPVLFFDCKKMYSSILAINPDIQFVMDLDEIYFSDSNKVERNLLENIRFNHTICCASSQTAKAYKKAFEKEFSITSKSFITLPTFLVSSYVKKRADESIDRSKPIRIGLQQGNFNASLLESLALVCQESKENVVVCVYGNNKQTIDFPASLTIEEYKAVKFLDFYSTIDQMNLDFMLVEGENTLTEPQKAIYQYGELALLSVPLLSDSKNAGSRFIRNKNNGFVFNNENELQEHLKTLFTNRNLAIKAGQTAQSMALKHLSWTADRAAQLTTIYK